MTRATASGAARQLQINDQCRASGTLTADNLPTAKPAAQQPVAEQSVPQPSVLLQPTPGDQQPDGQPVGELLADVPSPQTPANQTTAGFYRWQHYTRSANQALLHQQYQLAEQRYLRALQQAKQLQQLDPLADPHVAALVISLHNLADLALLNGAPAQARALLCNAFRQIWQLCQPNPHAQIPAQLWSHLQICRRELAFFCQSFGTDADCQQLLARPWPAAALAS